MRRPRRVQRWIATVLAVLFTAGPAWGLPRGAVVISGNAQVSQTGPRSLQIVQLGGPVVIQWRSFSIASGELVRFLQPGPASLAVNRVAGGSSSVILGQLLANGRIVLINPAGVTVGVGGLIKVAGLVATTLELRDADLRAGRLHLEQGPGGLATILNQGTIAVAPGGAVVLVAPGVINQGTITAELGSVQLASGRRLVVDFAGDALVRFAVEGALEHAAGTEAGTVSPGVRNEGRILADGGRVELTTKTAGDVLTGVVNNSGLIQARSLVKEGGVVRLIGGDDGVATATASGALRPAGEVRGVVSNTGIIDVSAKEAGAAPGRVLLLGERVGHGGTIDARGADGGRGGEVAIAATERSVLLPGSTIDVSGVGHASAGRVTVWADRDTNAATGSALVARGGERGGHGGFVEVSAGESLSFDAAVDARAPAGAAGTLLLDPRNIIVRTAGGVLYNPGVNNLFANNVGATNIITPASINAAAANVVLQANSDITVTDPIAMTNAGVGVTMEAGRSILVNASVATNDGPITLISNAPGAVIGDRAAGAGSITMGAGTTLNAGNQPITLTVGGLVGGNPGSITAVNLTSSAGGITLSTPNAVTLNGVVNSGAGPVTVLANTDGVGNQSFLMNAGSSITTTGAAANAVVINVNATAGGTGTATFRDISAGAGGIVTVTTDTGGNTTGGTLTQAAGTALTGGAVLSSANAVSLNGAINAGPATVAIQANTDGAGGQAFNMAVGSSITTTSTAANAVAINVNGAVGGTGAATVRDISTGPGGVIAVATDTGGNVTGGAITQVAATALAGGVLMSTPSTITLNGAINAGPAAVTLNANTDGAGAQGFVMNAGSSIATTNTGAGAVVINVNAAAGGTGTAAFRDISTGPGGSVTVQTDTGGNLTGGSLTQSSGTVSSGPVLLSSPNAVTLNGVLNAGADPVTIRANTDGLANQSFLMNAGSSIVTASTAANAVTINVNAAAGGTGTASLRDISTGPGGLITVTTNTGGNSTGGTISNVAATTLAGGVLLSSANAVTLSGNVNAGPAPVTIQANTDGAGNQGFSMAAASTITTTDASAGAVAVNVNTTAGGTGAAALGGITAGSGGTITAATNTGGNATGGSITRTGGTLDTGAGSLVLTAPTTGASSVGTAGTSIQTRTGSVTATAGSGGIFITEADGASFQATAAGAGQVNLASTAGPLTIAGPTSTGSGPITLASGAAVAVNANVGGGSGTITINANTDGAGAEGFIQSGVASIATTSVSVNAVRVNVNAAAGGTGGATLGNVTTGSGGRITVATSTGGNVTGGSIDQSAGGLLDTGTGSVILTTPMAGASGIGGAGVPIRTTANTITATAGAGGVYVTETDGASFTATATGAGPVSLASTAGTLTLAGATSTGTGPISLSGPTVGQNANLTTGGPITVTATAGPLTMAGAAQSTAGGNITYQGAGDVTLGGLTSGAAVAVTSTGGSILDGNAAAVNVSGATTTLQSGNVIGSAADPLDIAVTGLANVNAGGVQAGDSIQINGTTGDNTLHFPLTVPGQIFFNGILLPPLAPPVVPPLAPPLAPGPAGSASLGVYTQAIASCDLTAGAADLVRLPASCAPGASAKQDLAAPVALPGEPSP